MLKYWIVDDVFDEHSGFEDLVSLGRAPRFTQWSLDLVRSYLGDSVLEVGSGIGVVVAGDEGEKLSKANPIPLVFAPSTWLKLTLIEEITFDPRSKDHVQGSPSKLPSSPKWTPAGLIICAT